MKVKTLVDALVQRSMSYVPSYNVYRNQGKFGHCELLLELLRLIAEFVEGWVPSTNSAHSHELWSKIVNLNLDLNGVGETAITLAI